MALQHVINDTLSQHILNKSLNNSDFQVVHEDGIYKTSITKNCLSFNKRIYFVDTLYDVPVSIIVLLSIFYGSISVMAVVGNSLVIWIVATTRQMQTVTNLFIANLALADVTIGIFAIPFQVSYNRF